MMFPRAKAGYPKSSTVFKKLMNEGPFPVVGVFGATAQQAQIAQSAGFGFFGISGAHTSTTFLGLPDAGLITLSEIVENTRRVCEAVTIPVHVDCDTGFGNAINVCRTVDSMIRAGAASIFMEDQVAPKRCGYVKGKELISIEEAVGKYKAALDVRNNLDPDFMIFARTDARGAVGGGIDEVIRRGKAYFEAGVDVLYVEALKSREEIRVVKSAFPDKMLKVTFSSKDEPPLTLKEYGDLGICTISLHISVVGAIAVHDFLHRYAKEGDQVAIEFAEKTRNHPIGEFRFFDLAGFPDVHELEERYLPAEALARYDSSIGEYDPRRSAR